ncbi:MAG: SurA N-terminal domain-containing protein [Pseudolabrys sp.]|jgi:SurA N-terminal domain.|nr:SurA N-terminal domain-containing protein [Pseudolabrys sp.]
MIARYRAWFLSVVVTLTFAAPTTSYAQVVVIANGSPITEYDIQQRMKLDAISQKSPNRQQAINDLIDDRLKIARAKVYGLEVGDSEITGAFENMAGRQHITLAQFTQVLERSGISPNTVKARIRAEMTWQQLIRGKYNSSLQIGDSDIAKALKDKNEGDAPAVGYIYTLYPVMVVVARGSSEATISAKRSEAENLRSRFASCADGLAMARGLRDVAVRDPITRNSADLSPQLRDLLGNIQVGRLTPPEVTAQGLQMFAVCNKKESATDSPQKREMREQLFVKRFESESKKYLDEIRKAAMIEYKNNK